MEFQKCMGCPHKDKLDAVCGGQLDRYDTRHVNCGVVIGQAKEQRQMKHEQAKQAGLQNSLTYRSLQRDRVVRKGIAYRLKYPNQLIERYLPDCVVAFDEQGRDGSLNLATGEFEPAPDQSQQIQYNTPRARLLNEVMEIVHKDRNANYGNPEDNFKQIADLWNAYLQGQSKGIPSLKPADVAIMNMLIKVARLAKNPAHHDSAVDIAGYAACLADIQERMNRPVNKPDGLASGYSVGGGDAAAQSSGNCTRGEK